MHYKRNKILHSHCNFYASTKNVILFLVELIPATTVTTTGWTTGCPRIWISTARVRAKSSSMRCSISTLIPTTVSVSAGAVISTTVTPTVRASTVTAPVTTATALASAAFGFWLRGADVNGDAVDDVILAE